MIDLTEVQSLVLKPHRSPKITIDFLRFKQAGQLREFLWESSASVAYSGTESKNRLTVNVGITGEGVRLLGLDERTLAALPREFMNGMAASSGRLGDVRDSSPDEWPAPFSLADGAVHVVVLTMEASATRGGPDPDLRTPRFIEILDDVDLLAGKWVGERRHDDSEPFGFRDGISNPVVEGAGVAVTAGNGVWEPGTGEWRAAKAGEVLLGHLDEAGAISGHSDAAQVERDGSYLVIRKLEQDVDWFNDVCQGWSDKLNESTSPDRPWTADEIGAQIVGRHKDGRLIGQKASCPANDQLYRGGDAMGVPPTSHIRRANPRDDVNHADKIVSRHMIFRRGIPYVEPDSGAEGLLFMAACADIRRQFEFVNSHWLQNGNRFGLGTEPDPLIGRQQGPYGGGHRKEAAPPDEDLAVHRASISDRKTARLSCDGLAPFVRTRGGTYVLLPSRSALARLSDWRGSR